MADQSREVAELRQRIEELERAQDSGQFDHRIPLLATGFDIEDAIFPPAVRAYNLTGVTIPNNSSTILNNNLSSEWYDTDGMHRTDANTGRLTAVTTGIYVVSANIEWAANTTGVRSLDILVDGTTTIASISEHEPNGSNTLSLSVTTSFPLKLGEWFVMRVFQNSGGDLNIVRSDRWSPEFAAVWVAPHP